MGAMLGVTVRPGISVFPSLSVISLALTRFSGEIRSVRPALEQAVDEVIIPRIKSNFEGETAAGFYSWTQLSQRTQKDRQSQGYNPTHPILQRSRKLMREATTKRLWSFDGQQGMAFVEETSFHRAPYGPLLHKGSADRKIPSREFMVINQTDVNDIERIFKDWIDVKIASGLLSFGASRRLLGR